MTLIELIGILPAVIFPLATVIQLLHLLKTKSSEGVSALAWVAFSIGNVSLYIYAEKYTEPQAIFGMLLTSLLQVFIVILILKYRNSRPLPTE